MSHQPSSAIIAIDLPLASLNDKQRLWLCDTLAQLERQILPDDAWDCQMINAQLSQFGAGVVLAVVNDGTMDCLSSVLAGELSDLVVAGYCLYQSVFELAEIHRIGTRADFLRQGVANQMMHALLMALPKLQAQSLLLEVRADNQPAIALYHRHGFVQIDVRAGYYQTDCGRVDALILQKQLA